MKNVIYVSAIALSLVFTASAYSAQGMYVSGNVGLSLVDDIDLTDGDNFNPSADVEMEFDSGVSFAGAIGYRMDNLRVEGEIGYQENDIDKIDIGGIDFEGIGGDVSVLTLLVNGYWDFYNGSAFTPFLTAGLGVAEAEVNDFERIGSITRSYTEDDTVFAWNVGAGVSYAVSEEFDIELKYRYLLVADLEFEEGRDVDGPNSHNISLGVRYNF